MTNRLFTKLGIVPTDEDLADREQRLLEIKAREIQAKDVMIRAIRVRKEADAAVRRLQAQHKKGTKSA